MMVTTDPSPEVRMAAALTLGDSDDPKALDALVMALQDEDPRVLEEVIDALAYTGNRSTIPYLQPFLNHPDEDVRDAAESAIDDLE
jgi:HEAT repeat protein